MRELSKQLPQICNPVRNNLGFSRAQVIPRVGVIGLVKILPMGDGQNKPARVVHHLKAVRRV